MKSRFPFHLIVLTVVFLANCEKPQSTTTSDTQSFPVSEKAFTQVSFPIKRSLRDQSNRPLEAKILGKTPGKLFVVREADGLSFEIAIASLCQEDQDYANSLPIQVPPADFNRPTIPTPTPSKHSPENDDEPPYIANRKQSIKELEEQNQLLKYEIESTSNSMLVRTKNTQIEKNEIEINRLRADIERYRSDNK
ncbi:MAG: hypothetical protein KDN19_21030 [Verrucomicrobiae bacterium]|nr:hypothetical protein [Verrucomicrobiae bacterium]